jgi:hypothetical protein
MKFTKKQRREIYEKAHDLIGKPDGVNLRFEYACTAIHYITNIDRKNILKYFPELNLFNPNDGFCAWWLWYEYEARRIALLFCAEMCKD